MLQNHREKIELSMSNRLKFFLGHLSVSIIMICVVISAIFFFWYPAPLAKAVDVTHIFLMMLAIDVIIGPLLGLLVYKEGKKSLKFDLTIIILMQLTAFSFGIYSLAQGRPAWIIFYIDRFELVRNNEIIIQKPDDILPEYKKPSWLGVRYAAVQRAQDNQKNNQDLFTEVLSGISLAQMPARYTNLSKVKNQIQNNSYNLNKLNQINDFKKVAVILAKYPQANAWIPLKSNSMDMVVLVNNNTGKIIKIVDLRPW